MDLTTSTRVRALLEGGGIQQGSLATLIAQAITDVSAYVERYLDRVVLVGAQVEYHDVLPLGQRFRLAAYPVTAWVDVRHDTGRAFGADTVVDASAYVRDDANGWLEFDRYYLADGPRVLRVSYTGGMAANVDAFVTAYPALAGAVDQQVAALVQRRHSLTAQAVNAGNSGASFQGGMDLLPGVKRVLDEYRRW